MTNDHWAQDEFILGPYTLPFLTERWVFTANDTVEGSPTVEGTNVYVADKSGAVFQLDARTGSLIWIASLPAISGDPIVNGVVYVGVASTQESLVSEDANYVPTFRGSVVALDESTGEILWQTYTVPAGGAIWESNFAVDTARDAVYVTTGNNYSVPPAVATCQTAAGSNNAALDACPSLTTHRFGNGA